jgi:hypothetical protein
LMSCETGRIPRCQSSSKVREHIATTMYRETRLEQAPAEFCQLQ